jgi:hypothetical protein
MFDYVRCRYPLPHHQDALFQTKDLLSLVDPGEWLGGLLDNYQITKDGRLHRQRHKYKIVKTPRRFPSFHLKSIKSCAGGLRCRMRMAASSSTRATTHRAQAVLDGSSSIFDSPTVAFKMWKIGRERP